MFQRQLLNAKIEKMATAQLAHRTAKNELGNNQRVTKCEYARNIVTRGSDTFSFELRVDEKPAGNLTK